MKAEDVVIPRPASVTDGDGSFTLSAATTIAAPAGTEAIADMLASMLRAATGLEVPVSAGAAADGSIAFVLDAIAHKTTGDEGYELSVTPASVVIRAAKPAGLFYGSQTLLQLLPRKPGGRGANDAVSNDAVTNDAVTNDAVTNDAVTNDAVTIDATHIVDRPRYPWRGAMLDVARHFFAAADVMRYLDEIALYKLNVLHLHLSDDQGWRIAIGSRPLLTEIGGRTAVGGGSGGYYSKQDYENIVRYAAARFITVVPEIDMPGHTNAALASYAELNCDGSAREPFTGIDVGFSTVCVGKETTYDFLDEVIGELAQLTPGKYLHIGGDEVQELTPVQYAAFITRVQSIVSRHGKTLVGWEEAVHGSLTAGSVLQYWNTTGDYADKLKAATDRGVHVVLSPADRTYLDMKYDDDYALGLEWAGRVSVQQAYDWDPADVIPGAKPGSVLGVEAAIWSETLSTFADVESMAFPRLAAVAEVAWSGPARDWPAFRVRLAAQARRWDEMGVHYHRAPGVDWPAKP